MSIPDRATRGSAIEGRVLLCPVPGKYIFPMSGKYIFPMSGRGGLLDAGNALELW
ncbi:hypothetical protein LJG69_17765 [Pseudomonas aeruginosa]|uniref:hypothetical protein n=1 Tax=Pseudomonas aeruginosa TaxID=287 RepID=UPI001D0A8C3A|nr:hypothetical protein [Pseudomonas aeruginosa]MCC0301083.1 hypothetical protein [Pseudomonas aeruginosa]MCC0408482.1 hypothetical protein [Pseudomonas aeruginosa]MCC0433624.1 hypothetical protein [Pseudomonas aeruginosa]